MPATAGHSGRHTGPAGQSGGGGGRSSENQSPSLLSPTDYDVDAVSIRSDQDSDSDDDALQQRARNSRELRAHDRLVFLEEDEVDQLVINTLRRQDSTGGRIRRRSSNLAVANPLRFLGIRRYSDGAGGSGSRSPSPNASRAVMSADSLFAVDEKGREMTTRSTTTPPPPLPMAGDTPTTAAASSVSKSAKRKQRRQRRKEKKKRLLAEARNGEDGALMYEMEEGGLKEGSSTGDSSEREDSEERDRHHLAETMGRRKHRQYESLNGGGGGSGSGRGRRLRWLLLYALIAVAFALLVLGAWRMTLAKKAQRVAYNGQKNVMSNGTALFAPTTLLVSLDGFRADFLQRGLTPRLNAFVREGVSPRWMLPSFPSVTFPNHYTIVTGLYPESHGVVGNTFWDPALQADFHYTDPARSLDPKWWDGEPFWVTAERAGVRTAIHMWPGSEAHILGVEPTYVDKYNGDEALPSKVARILEFLDKPGLEADPAAVPAFVDGSRGRERNVRPQLIAAYVPNVDADGHRYGPNSTEIRGTIQAVDTMLDQLFQGLAARNLTHIVNVVVVSDHGMATTDATRLLQLDDLVDLDRIEHVDGWPLVGLRPRAGVDVAALYDDLVTNRTANNPNVEVYLRDSTMPARYHFSRNPRIAPLWLVPKTGWNIVPRSDFDVAAALKTNAVYHPRGLHGYDHEHPLMRAIFVARGPAFPHAPNSRLKEFQNIEVYNILCDSVGLAPRPNNGTLRLPLAPVGLHSSETTVEEPADPVPPYTVTPSTSSSSSATVGVDPVKGLPATTAATTAAAVGVDPVPVQPTTKTSATGQVTLPATPPATTPTAGGSGSGSGSDEGDGGGENKSTLDKVSAAAQDFWDWFTDKVNEVWDKVTGSKAANGAEGEANKDG
ncbi:type I phosphodiesterase/nucleotide pyrophosphatase [Niveomyces insectorum RCEF 264]|uniref:Type I phosphodiesterase/nucleotide pyrophosphatase n=1 Tax=Niveomyces insectorum RCEF 264 TaxID=1081102 RepID=A0A167UJZ8_9HYPO|nr:type I phosphodiesterase/nucleotide pyrophosphatase [Niveomyces insectorum RCEF 264]